MCSFDTKILNIFYYKIFNNPKMIPPILKTKKLNIHCGMCTQLRYCTKHFIPNKNNLTLFFLI